MKNWRILLISTLFLFSPLKTAHPEYQVLKKIIIDYNTYILEDFPQQGEVGILKLPPLVARSFGLKVYVDSDYHEAMELFKKAHHCLEDAKRYLVERRKESFAHELAQKAGDLFLTYKRLDQRAKHLMSAYISRLNPGNDQRLEKEKCLILMEKLLDKCLRENDYCLRDSLGMFYNLSKGITPKPTLTVTNIRFVNHVYNQYLKLGLDEPNHFNLERVNLGVTNKGWKSILEDNVLPYVPIIERILNDPMLKIYPVDPLLFISLIKKESFFNPLAVSSVGAAGLTQIMPYTAKALGMRQVHIPHYYVKACKLLKKERELKSQAINTLYQINEKNKLQLSRKARSLMQKAIDIKKLKESLFLRYKKELIHSKWDQRLDPEKALRFGFIYFSQMLKINEGDLSLALASYNAGPGKVKQYNGIPPFEETINFRNKVLKYYREYQRNSY